MMIGTQLRGSALITAWAVLVCPNAPLTTDNCGFDQREYLAGSRNTAWLNGDKLVLSQSIENA
jgi:hypothetical protein